MRKMPNVKLALGSILALLALLAIAVTPAMAQPVTSPLSGTVTIDGAPAPDGSGVRVYVGNETSARAETNTTAGEYHVVVVGAAADVGKALSFKVKKAGELVWLDATSVPASPTFANYDPQVVNLSATSAPAPTIAFSPASFSFNATQGGANPTSKTLQIWNSGAGTLNWTVSDNATWLSLNPTSGTSTGEHDSVTVSVNTSGKSAGNYSANITISDPGATNTPQTVPVTLTIVPPAPTIDFSPASFSFNATQGGANPPSKTLYIWNSGTGTLNWTVTGDAPWLSLSPTSGTSTGEHDPVTVSVNTSGKSAGSYSANITISASGATNTPQTVPVTLNIVPLPPPTDAWVDDDWNSQADVDIYNAAHGTHLVWQYDAFNIIQDAIDAVSGSTVHVLQGEYDGFAVEERNNLNIIAEEAGAVVNNAIDYPDWACSIMALVANSTAINIEGLDFDGLEIERTVIEGIAYGNSTGSITDVTVSHIVGTEMGMGICVWGGEIDTVNISDSTVEGCQVGVMVGEDQANLDNCTITGLKGENVFSCGVMAMYGAVNIDSCDISDFWVGEPEAEVAGFGVMVGIPIVGAPAEALGEQFGQVVDGGVSTVEISGCSKVFNNNFGIYVSVGGDLVANGNDIQENDIYGVYNEAVGEVDAENNWWGDASGPSGVGPGTGDAVSDNVDYDPWLKAPCQKPVTELTADFSASPRTGLAPLRVQFTDETTGGVKPYSYEWDFGDDKTSTAENPTHMYTVPGSYTVTLTVTDDVDNTDSETKPHYIVIVGGLPPVGAPSFSVSNLLISPEQAQPNQQVTISVNIANIGGATGTYTAALYIEGQLENSETVSVGAGSTRQVMFTVTRADAGTYDVSFAGLQGQFTVVATPLFGTGLGTGGIIAIIVVVIALIAALVFLVPRLRKRT